MKTFLIVLAILAVAISIFYLGAAVGYGVGYQKGTNDLTDKLMTLLGKVKEKTND